MTKRKIFLVLFLLALPKVSGQRQLPPGQRHYLFVSNQRIVTVELTSRQKAILNYFNLGETYETLLAPALLVRDQAGNHYSGHTIRVEEAKDPLEVFKVSELIAPRTYGGFEILGNFRLQAPAQQAFVRLGSRILELEPIQEEDFERLGARIAQLNLELRDGKKIVLQAGFRRGFGEIHRLGSQQADELVPLFPDSGLLPPVLLEDPKPLLPSSLSEFPDPVAVTLRAVVNRAGGLAELAVLEGLDDRLDSLAMETVRNSWVFLPAVSETRVVDAELELVVIFRRN